MTRGWHKSHPEYRVFYNLRSYLQDPIYWAKMEGLDEPEMTEFREMRKRQTYKYTPAISARNNPLWSFC